MSDREYGPVCVLGVLLQPEVTGTLVESWNGTFRSVKSSLSPCGVSNILDGVSCMTQTKCVAVGYSFFSNGSERTLIESRDRATWSLTHHPATNSANLDGVSCSRPSSRVAAGAAFNSSGTDQTLVETGSPRP